METPTLIYCGGGNLTFAQIAIDAGFRFGAQLPDTIYHPLYFADQDWREPDRRRYMEELKKHRPVMATVLDWERDDQLAEVLDWAEEAAQYVEMVLVVPKVPGGISRLLREIDGKRVVLAYSVPTKYAGTPVPAWEFAGWPVHLLGGSPHVQMRLWRQFSSIADVVSADGNMINKMAQRCSFWSKKKGPKGHFVGLNTAGRHWGKDANAEAFRRSCCNVMAAWQDLAELDRGRS